MSQGNANANASMKSFLDEIYVENDFDTQIVYDDYEKELEKELDILLTDAKLLEEEKKKIGNPDALGKVILDEVLKKFGEQIGLNATDETLLQKYDKNHKNDNFNDTATKVRNDKSFKDKVKKTGDEHLQGKALDEYTGKLLTADQNPNVDHIISIKYESEDPRFKQSGLSLEEVVNIDENLAVTNESLNKSKGASTNTETAKRIEKEKANLKNDAKEKKAKIDSDNTMTAADKKAAKAKIDSELDEKLSSGKYAADSNKMIEAEKKAKKAIAQKVNKNVAKQVSKKAAGDAIQQMASASLIILAKEIVNGFVEFIKEKSKSFKSLLLKIKTALANFFAKIGEIFKTGVSSFIGTVVTEIFEPIFKIFGKLISFIKQGISSFIDAIKYLTDPKHKTDPFYVKMAEVGKIITGALGATGAILLSTVFEGVLDSVGLGIQIPLFGTLSGIIGAFLASLITGILSAIVMNLIDKWMARRQKTEIVKQQIEQNNKILQAQDKLTSVKQINTDKTFEDTVDSIKNRHQDAAKEISATLEQMTDVYVSDNSEKFEDIETILNSI